VLPLILLAPVFADPASPAQDTYVRFLVFYGLAFPGYVLLFIGPLRPLERRRSNLAAFGAAVVLAAPLYELAFLHGLAALSLPPLAALVAWKAWGSLRAKTRSRALATPGGAA
jgi:hypothetical protein